MDRPWEVDPLPLLLSAQEWQAIEEGVTQRAELLNRVLADIYGPQELLKSGAVPPAVVAGIVAACVGCLIVGIALVAVVVLWRGGKAIDLGRYPGGTVSRAYGVNDKGQIVGEGNLVLYGLTAPFAAALMERFGIRAIMATALVLIAAGSGLTVFMTAAWQLTVL